jgi:GT2 family glycosyltransferase
MTSIELSIIIVNWNSKDYLKKCIASVVENTKGIQYEIIVVDSASFDGCEQMLLDCYPQVNFIQSAHNIGFAGANNIGANNAHGDILFFLNPDTVVIKNAVELLYANLLKLPQAGIIGCRLLNTDKTLQTSCVQPLPAILNQVLDADILYRWFPKSTVWLSAAKFEGSLSPVKVEAVSGACMMIRQSIFNQVQGFSRDYFMYAEDLDLCYKVQSAGFTNYYLAEAEIIHHGGGSTQHKRGRFSLVMIPESLSRLLRKMRGPSYSFCYRLALSIAAVMRLFLLLFLLPFALLKNKKTEWQAIFFKWIVILRWGLGLEKWVHQYDQLNPSDSEYNENKGS